MKYRLITAFRFSSHLEDAVTEALSECWELQGGVSIAYISEMDAGCFAGGNGCDFSLGESGCPEELTPGAMITVFSQAVVHKNDDQEFSF